MLDEFNAFVHRDEEGAKAARAASRARWQAQKSLSALDGTSVGIKDNIDVAGMPTRGGFGGDGVVAAADAPVVASLRAGGAVLLGKLAMDEAGLSATGDNPHNGRTLNPLDPARSPGGSSGGAAAAVAGRLCGVALGTDSLGSVRIPAAYCGIVGFKPGRGVLSTEGTMPTASLFDHVGVLAARVAGIRTAMSVLVPGMADTASVASLAGLKLLRPRELAEAGLAPGVAAAYDRALADLAKAGGRIVDGSIAGWQPRAAAKAAFLLAEAESALLHKDALAAGAPGLSPAVRKLLEFGRDCGSGRLIAAMRRVQATAEAWERAAREADVIVLPTVPGTAFRHGDPAPANSGDLTAPANMCGLPAIGLPGGEDEGGLPVGLQLIGKRGDDAWLLSVAAAVEDALSAR